MKPSSGIKASNRSMPQRFASAHCLEELLRLSSHKVVFMKFLVLVTAALVLSATPLFAHPAADGAPPPSPLAASSQENVPPAVSPSPPAATAPNSTETPGAAPLRVMVGKSLLINTTERLKRVSVTDPTVADALVVTPTQVLVNGLAPGEVSLLIWDELERSRSFDLRVDVDISAASEEMHRLFPDQQISVTPSRSAIVLSGHVTNEDIAKHAGSLASAYSKNVVNVLTFGPVGAEEVLLEVKFAEVDRSALTQMGLNLLSTGAGNTIGSTTTGQFGGFTTGAITNGGNANGTGTATTSTTVGNLQ